jgi:hypothetical protein
LLEQPPELELQRSEGLTDAGDGSHGGLGNLRRNYSRRQIPALRLVLRLVLSGEVRMRSGKIVVVIVILTFVVLLLVVVRPTEQVDAEQQIRSARP